MSYGLMKKILNTLVQLSNISLTRKLLIKDYYYKLEQIIGIKQYSMYELLKYCDCMLPPLNYWYNVIKFFILEYCSKHWLRQQHLLNTHPWRQLGFDNTYFNKIIQIVKYDNLSKKNIYEPLNATQSIITCSAGMYCIYI